MDKKYVFIAGPFSSDPMRCTARAILAANTLAGLGFYPFIPHLFIQWDFLYAQTYDFWLEQTTAWVSKCDCVLRLAGKSPGADREVALAKKLNLPVFDNYNALLNWRRDKV